MNYGWLQGGSIDWVKQVHPSDVESPFKVKVNPTQNDNENVDENDDDNDDDDNDDENDDENIDSDNGDVDEYAVYFYYVI